MSQAAPHDTPCSVTRLTAARPGAIAVIQLIGHPDQLASVVNRVCERALPDVGRMQFTSFRDDEGHVDEGLTLRVSEELVQFMPHGGPRVQQRIMGRCVAAGAQLTTAADVDPMSIYPEAADTIEAWMLRSIAEAASPRAIDLLLDQPNRLRATTSFSAEDLARSRRLNRLMTPATVVVAGPANVGKSTLSNALLGRSMSIAVDQPGTTRDYTVARIDFNGVVAHWCDTPGLRASNDEIEQSAIAHARLLWKQADVLIAMTDAEHDWPVLDREPDLRLASKCDLQSRADADLNISTVDGTGLTDCVSRIRQLLVGDDDLDHPGPWCFHPELQQLVESNCVGD